MHGVRFHLSSRGLKVIICTLIVVWLVFAAQALSLTSNDLTDFSVFYSAAAVVRDHSGSIYDISTIIATAQRHSSCALFPHPAYLYPPLLAVMLAPLVALPCGAALQVWIAVQLTCWAGSAALMTLWLRRLWTPGLVSMAIALTFSLLCWPLASGLEQFAQVDALVLFGLLLAPWLIVHGHPKLGGAVLAFIAMIKVIPALLIVYYLLRGRWRVVAGALICGVVLMVFQAAAVGFPELIAMRAILSNSAVFLSQADNFSLLHLPVWLALLIGMRIAPTTTWPGEILIGTTAALFIGATLVGHKRVVAANDEEIDLLGYAWAISIMLLVTPLVWLHYLAWLLVPLVLCGGYLLGHHSSRRSLFLLAVIVAGYMLATLRLPLAFDTTPEYALDPYIGSYALRPLLMVAHPIGELLMALTTGLVFVRAASISPRRYFSRAGATTATAANVSGGVSAGSQR